MINLNTQDRLSISRRTVQFCCKVFYGNRSRWLLPYISIVKLAVLISKPHPDMCYILHTLPVCLSLPLSISLLPHLSPPPLSITLPLCLSLHPRPARPPARNCPSILENGECVGYHAACQRATDPCQTATPPLGSRQASGVRALRLHCVTRRTSRNSRVWSQLCGIN